MNGVHPLWYVLAATLIALLPIVAGLMTSYLKISIVLSMLRSGLGTPQMPGGMIVMALSLALTLYVMAPVIKETAALSEGIDLGAIYKAPTASALQKLQPLVKPWHAFMLRYAGKRELQTFRGLSAAPETEAESEPDLRTTVPAFLVSELKAGFAMGFAVLLPFLVIDLIVSNILVGVGMYMVSPIMISLPLKLMLFVACDGWLLLCKGLIKSYGV